jgi:ElaB/YqjD/DUF883 family membrane-anchored ribosome-binding protein
MNDQQLENKIRQDAEKIRRDLSSLGEDSIARFGRFEDNVKQAAAKAKNGLSSWGEDNVSQLSDRFEKMSGDARDSVIGAAAMARNDVRSGLSQYNNKAQKFADQVPGGFSEKVAKFPWVALSAAIGVGFLLAILLKPSRKPLM